MVLGYLFPVGTIYPDDIVEELRLCGRVLECGETVELALFFVRFGSVFVRFDCMYSTDDLHPPSDISLQVLQEGTPKEIPQEARDFISVSAQTNMYKFPSSASGRPQGPFIAAFPLDEP